MGTIIRAEWNPAVADPALLGTRQGIGGWLGSILLRPFRVLVVWQQRANQRHALSRLDSRMLSDIGLSRSEAEEEYRKPFWQA